MKEMQLHELLDHYRNALLAIARGEGVYGAQALEYKNIARVALGEPKVGEERAVTG